MKAEYQSRKDGRPVHNQWTTDLRFVRENCKPYGAELWRRETETPEEAAVRRLDWISNNLATFYATFYATKEPIAIIADRLCPPPNPTEIRICWDTLEPVKEVPVWFSDLKKVWAAGMEKDKWICLTFSEMAQLITSGKVAIGATREAAIRNMEELRRAAK